MINLQNKFKYNKNDLVLFSLSEEKYKNYIKRQKTYTTHSDEVLSNSKDIHIMTGDIIGVCEDVLSDTLAWMYYIDDNGYRRYIKESDILEKPIFHPYKNLSITTN